MSKVTYEEAVKSLEIIGDIRFYDEDEEMMIIKDYFDSEYHLLKAFIIQHKPPTYEEVEKACDYLGYGVSFNHYDNGMRLSLTDRLTLDSMTVFTNGDIAFTSNPDMYRIKKEFSQLHCLIIRYLKSLKGEQHE